jgi:putative chitobiose transport system permease protein
MIVTVWRGFGYYMMIFLAGLAVIPKELEEASRIDGANRFQRVFHIIIPMLKPTLILIFVLSSTAAIKIFTELYIMIPGTPDSNKTLVYFMYKQAFENFDFGYGSAAGVIIFILTMGFSYINIKLMEEK